MSSPARVVIRVNERGPCAPCADRGAADASVEALGVGLWVTGCPGANVLDRLNRPVVADGLAVYRSRGRGRPRSGAAGALGVSLGRACARVSLADSHSQLCRVAGRLRQVRAGYSRVQVRGSAMPSRSAYVSATASHRRANRTQWAGTACSSGWQTARGVDRVSGLLLRGAARHRRRSGLDLSGDEPVDGESGAVSRPGSSNGTRAERVVLPIPPGSRVVLGSSVASPGFGCGVGLWVSGVVVRCLCLVEVEYVVVVHVVGDAAGVQCRQRCPVPACLDDGVGQGEWEPG